ncbi:MAG TPA: PadR family transcriptional regulator [Candidatus Aquabacterium excrementipullorum]|nr:PadR family transcriptional regulator [Candidatus Aquabacterium excrementipullorum]
MSLPHALLTALVERPSSGSDLAARFDKTIGYFWRATHQQIYRELARLEEAGLIQSLPEETTRGRKRAYKILPTGRKELKRWIALNEDPPFLRDDLMVRLWAEAAVGPTKLDKEIERRLKLHTERLETYRKYEARDYGGDDHPRDVALRYLVLRCGIRYESYWIQAATEALEILKADKPCKPDKGATAAKKRPTGK